MNWEELANTKGSDVTRPPARPSGHYIAVITGRGEQGASSKKGTLFIKFPVRVQEALEDVDTEELNEAGGLPFNGSVTFYLTPQSLWRFTEFYKGLGISDSVNVLEAAEELANCGEPFVVEGRQEPSDRNPEDIFFRLDNPIPLSAWQQRQAA